MFRLSAIVCLVIGSAAASAGDYKFINTDGSILGQLCIAVAESKAKDHDNIRSLAMGFGVSPMELSIVRCNGESLAAFAHKYSSDESAAIRAQVVSLGDEKPESQLCLAALVSEEEFKKTWNATFPGVQVTKEVLCNGLPMSTFVAKYRESTIAPRATMEATLR
jgi:hypothetical protein